MYKFLSELKAHTKMSLKVIYSYFLGLLIAWAGFPIISIFTLRNDYDGVSKNVFLPDFWAESKFFYFENINSIFTGIVTVILVILLYVNMHEMGQRDLKPYKWAKYKAKGFTVAIIAGIIIVLTEFFIIWIADRYIAVAHPQWNIKSLHNYLTMVIYAPFYWFYHAIQTENMVMPGVNYANALYVFGILVPVSGFGYFMGYTDRHIVKKAPKSKLLRRLFYGKQSKKWKE